MPKTKEQKKKIIEDLKEKIENQKAIFFIGIGGLKAKESFDLREKFKKEECFLSVVKKTLLDIALKEKNINIDTKKLTGQVALVLSYKDEISPAKIIYQFSLNNQNLKILGGFLNNQFIGNDDVVFLAKLPTREELLAKLVGSIKAPISNLIYALQYNIKGLINVLAKAKT